MKKIILFFTALISLNTQAQSLVQQDSVTMTNAQIWGVLSDKGDSLCMTYLFNPGGMPHLFLRKIDYNNIHNQSAPKQLTFNSDFTSTTSLTDHKQLILNNQIFITFSTVGDQDLFLFKTDINGNRIGSMITVIQGSTDPTNDMILTTDSTYIYVLHFNPPNQHNIYKYDTNLNLISTSSTTTLPHNNIGSAIYNNGNFDMYTGSIFGFNSNLIRTQWTSSWSPITSQNLINSSSGDGNWFATGIAHWPTADWWIVGMNHIQTPQTIGQEHVDILVFNNTWNVVDRYHITGDGFFRPHFIIKGNYLYVAYDANGNGVFLEKYLIQNTNAVATTEANSTIHVFPNPADDQITLARNGALGNYSLAITDLTGKVVWQQAGREESTLTIALNAFASGMYVLQYTNAEGTSQQKISVR